MKKREREAFIILMRSGFRTVNGQDRKPVREGGWVLLLWLKVSNS